MIPALPTLETLPAGAHFLFLCPFCQIAGTESRLATVDAERLEWLEEGRLAVFHNVGCKTCGKAVSVKAGRSLPA